VEKGKVTGSGSRAIYFNTSPSRLSKTRSLPPEESGKPFEKDQTDIWKQIFAFKNQADHAPL
jgi:hypothetical protein